MSNLRIAFAVPSLLVCSFATGQEVDPDYSAADGEADGFWPGDPPPFEYLAEAQNLIQEAGCSDDDEQCKRLVAVRYALRLPEGFSSNPDCIQGTVCVVKRQTLTHDDLVAILEVVSPQIRANWVNITMQEV